MVLELRVVQTKVKYSAFVDRCEFVCVCMCICACPGTVRLTLCVMDLDGS